MDRSWDRLDPRSYVRLQGSLLRDIVRRYLYPFSPFYRQLFDEHGIKPRHIRDVRDLETIPLVSGEDFSSFPEDDWRPFRALLRPDEHGLKRTAHGKLLRRLAWETFVRGDQAAERLLAEEFKPVQLHVPPGNGPLVGYTMRDLSALTQVGARLMAVAGGRRTDVAVSTMPFASDLPFWLLYHGALGSGMSAFHVGGGESVRPSQAAAWMGKAGATILAAQPAYAEGLLRGAPPAVFARLRLLMLWTPAMEGARERFTVRLRTGGASDAAVVSVVGVAEARTAWAECPPPPGRPGFSHGYHTYPDLELLEVVDDEGRTVADGEPGEIVYTSLDWRGSALLRFRTGVVARRGITWARCPGCRRTVPRIAPDLSRVEWRARIGGPRGAVTVDLADVIPVLWRATGVPLWQLDVLKGGGPRGTDVVRADLGGALPREAAEIEQELTGYGIGTRVVPLRELTQRMGVGLERPEVRVRVRRADQ